VLADNLGYTKIRGGPPSTSVELAPCFDAVAAQGGQEIAVFQCPFGGIYYSEFCGLRSIKQPALP
jgi:hypothetical protein